ncbi:MAG TPA: type II toxin-antitoxin system VapC family toxin [Candidatus Thermoplasmatota archaeon]|nr:type II toxin-antitoxin system VapC family toxin [Candidatus Thermoplasmatota archaeon]
MAETLVLDASAGLRVALEDQPGHAAAVSCYQRALEHGSRIIVPELFLYEAGNVLGRAAAPPDRQVSLLLASYETVEVVRPSLEALARAMRMVSERRLSFYDAAYLALAEEKGGVLWTEDKEILRAFPHLAVDTKKLLARFSA